MEKTYKLLDGREVEATNRRILGFFNIGDKLESHFENSEVCRVIGFTVDNQVIVSVEGISFKSFDPETLLEQYENKNQRSVRDFKLISGDKLKPEPIQRLGDYFIGDSFRIIDSEHFLNKQVVNSQHIEVVGFANNKAILDFDDQYIAYDWDHLDKIFSKV